MKKGAAAKADNPNGRRSAKMIRIKLAGVCLVALFALTSIASASAAEYIYKINGSKLEAGSSAEITAAVKKAYILKGEALGIKTKIECKKQKVAKGGKIQGGKPGKSEEQIEFEECKALEPSGCTKVEVKPTPAVNEIVTVMKPTALSGDLATLFTPKTGTTFTKIKFEGCLLNAEVEVTGTAAGQDSPEKTEQVAGTLIFPKEQITEILQSSGATKAVGLKFGGNPSTLEGESSIELVSKSKWGVF